MNDRVPDLIASAVTALETAANDGTTRHGKAAPIVKKVALPKRVGGGRGYLLIDNRHGDTALTGQLPNGEIAVIAPGEVWEAPTLTCAHCNTITVLNPKRSRPRNWCRKCNHYVCDLPGCNRDCTPTALCVDLALRYPTLNEPFLARGKAGEVLFDPTLRDKTRIF